MAYSLGGDLWPLCTCGHGYLAHDAHSLKCQDDPSDWGCCYCKKCAKCPCEYFTADKGYYAADKRTTPSDVR